MACKGSKQHVLDLIEREDFISTFNDILRPYNASIIDKKTVQPVGNDNIAEYGLQRFINERKLFEKFPSLNDFNFNIWWSPNGGKAPTWDMISLCQLDGKDAVLLVEAKAHKSEFAKSGKKRLDLEATSQAKRNLKNIEDRIKEACDSLNKNYKTFNISTDKYYQLSNRIAFAWKLKQLNVSVILIYLGFTCDADFNDSFEDHVHWEKEFNNYIKDSIPINFVNNKESDFLFIHSSLTIKK